MMRRTLSAILVLLLGASVARAEQASKTDIMKLFELSGAMDIIDAQMDQMNAIIEFQMMNKMNKLPHEAYFIFKDELKRVTKVTADKFINLQADYYAKNLTKQDVSNLLAIYQSPTWKKMVGVAKDYINFEFKAAFRQYAPMILEESMQRIEMKLKKKGLIKEKETGV